MARSCKQAIVSACSGLSEVQWPYCNCQMFSFCNANAAGGLCTQSSRVVSRAVDLASILCIVLGSSITTQTTSAERAARLLHMAIR